MGYEVFGYIPNIIGYVRLVLLGISWVFFTTNPHLSLLMYAISISLDALDGYAARTLNQTSAFGAWFDVVIDVISRGFIYCRTTNFGYLLACVEWLAFSSNIQKGAGWKATFITDPWLVRKVMEKNFKTPLGFFTIGSLQILPIWLYGISKDIWLGFAVPSVVQDLICTILIMGRICCFIVEMWCIWSNILFLISDRPVSKSY